MLIATRQAIWVCERRWTRYAAERSGKSGEMMLNGTVAVAKHVVVITWELRHTKTKCKTW